VGGHRLIKNQKQTKELRVQNHRNLFKYNFIKKNKMNKWIELLLGLILVIGAILFAFQGGIWGVGQAAIEFLKGGIFWFVVMIGALFILLGISDLKE